MPLTLLRRRLDVELDPAVAFRALHARSPNAFWLDSGVHAARGMSYLGASDDVRRWSSWAEVLVGLSEVGALDEETAAPVAGTTDAQRDTEAVLAAGGPDAPRDPEAVLAAGGPDAPRDAEAVLAAGGPDAPRDAEAVLAAGGPDAPQDPAFRLGWVGWLAYELGTLDEERAGRVPHPAHPVAVFLRVDRAVEFDHATGAVTLLALEAPDAEAWFAETIATLEAAAREAARATTEATATVDPGEVAATHPPAPVAAPPPVAAGVAVATASGAPVIAPPPASAGAAVTTPTPASAPLRTATARHDYDAYARLVEECKRVIERGDAYQLCLTNEFGVDYEPGSEPDPLETHLRLRAASPSHHGGYLRAGDTALLSTSPEQFLAVTPDRTVTTRPIKGTRPRGAGPVEDALLRAELAASEKERAENLMIVDLMRNDLSRVCAVGSVRVTELLEVESYKHVHQLVSTVEGTLADGVSGPDAVAACFPAGSMTGAPKRSAMTHLATLERAPRGIYSGAFGYLSFDGSIDLAMVIRSIVLTPGRASVGSGGGITALSDAADEVEETRVKAAALLAVLGAEAPERA